MTSTIEQPPSELAQPPDQSPHRNRPLLIAIAVLAVIAVTLGIALVYQSSNDNDGNAAAPEDVQAVLDDFLVAMETNDYEAMQTLVTSQFRRPFYWGNEFGPANLRDVWLIEDFAFLEDGSESYGIERVGDPIVRGEGPWYVSVAENWADPALEIVFEAIYTYVVVVDTDDVLRIDDAYWVGHGVAMDDES